MTENSWQFDIKEMNRIHMAIVYGRTFEQYCDDADVPSEVRTEVHEYWSNLAGELSKPLPPGHYWDVPSD